MKAEDFRNKARRCRALSQVTVVPEIAEQLRLWARDFDEIAESIDNREPRDEPAGKAP